MKKILGYALPIAIAGFFLWFTYSRDPNLNLSKMWAEVRTAHLFPIFITFITTLIAHWVRAMRWNMLFLPLGYKPSIRNSFLAVMSGYFANLIIPRAGEITRCTALLTSERIPFQTSVGSVLAERTIDLVVFGILTLAAFGIEYQTLVDFVTQIQSQGNANQAGDESIFGAFIWIVGLGVLVAGLLIYMARKPLMQLSFVIKAVGFIKGLLDGVLSVTKLKQPGLFILQTSVIWLCYFSTTYFSLQIFDFTLDLGAKAAFLLLVIGSFGIILPAPAAVGGPFQAFVTSALVMLYAKDQTLANAAATTMYYSQQLLTLVAGGISYLIMVKLANNQLST